MPLLVSGIPQTRSEVNKLPLVDLRPWHARPDAPQIDAARLRAEAAIQRAAQTAASPDAQEPV